MSEQKARRVNQERTSLATAIAGMKHWDWCPICRGGLDTGLECYQCGADLMPIYTAFKESLSVGNHGEPKACTGAEERGISGATGAGQHPDDNSESTGDSADRRSPDGTDRTPSPDESNRHPHEPREPRQAPRFERYEPDYLEGVMRYEEKGHWYWADDVDEWIAQTKFEPPVSRVQCMGCGHEPQDCRCEVDRGPSHVQA